MRQINLVAVSYTHLDVYKRQRLTRIFRQAQGSRIIMNAHRNNKGEGIDMRGGKDSDFFFATKESNQEVVNTIVQYLSRIHIQHKGKQELFLEANIDELKTLLEVTLIQSTGASNRIEGIFTSDKRLEELGSQKAEPRNRSEQEIAGYREVLATIHESYEQMCIRDSSLCKEKESSRII